jgi:hypothetical protein
LTSNILPGTYVVLVIKNQDFISPQGYTCHYGRSVKVLCKQLGVKRCAHQYDMHVLSLL